MHQFISCFSVLEGRILDGSGVYSKQMTNSIDSATLPGFAFLTSLSEP
ncbi:MAG TPA: hypothetical protein VNC84_05280 [Gammaproteobacteria bacterium]|nr:hypothetical protein [Gammaproteobacteria bacterium]